MKSRSRRRLAAAATTVAVLATAAVALAATDSFSSGNLSKPIPDNGLVTDVINVNQNGQIDDVNVKVRLNHTFDADLILALRHPSGKWVTLANSAGGSGDNYGSGPNSCGGNLMTFDDDAANDISTGTAPFTDQRYNTHDDELEELAGKQMDGRWKLVVLDANSADNGELGCWKLVIRH